MPDYGKRTGRDAFESLERRLAAAERELRRQRGGGLSTIDRGDTVSQPAPVEGQTMIQYDTDEPWYFASGEWRDFCCGSGTGGDSFYDAVANLAAVHTLLGYWRLGEGATPYADTSGHTGGAANMARVAHGTAMSQDYTPGALPAADDDGAVAFNAADYNVQGDVLLATNTRFRLSASDFTLALWVKPFGGSAAGQNQQVFGTWSPSNGGYAFHVAGTTGLAVFVHGGSSSTVSVIGPTLPFDEWTFVACVFHLTGTPVSELYLDGALVATDNTRFSIAAFNNLVLGGNGSGGANYASFRGAVDEASLWGAALTGDEVAALYQAGTLGGNAAAGTVSTADGLGGTSWEYPVEVWVNDA